MLEVFDVYCLHLPRLQRRTASRLLCSWLVGGNLIDSQINNSFPLEWVYVAGLPVDQTSSVPLHII